jgi:(1->4)-alpha-D-glucan 1-alpha-D-glucosylmutase
MYITGLCALLTASSHVERLAQWQLKALREAKLRTDWEAPNTEYEEAARSFLQAIMADEHFVADAARFARLIGPAGAVNGLAQTLLKLTVPGVPDFYQGTEFWDQSLVDPDNRQPVDFSGRERALETEEPRRALAVHWRDGRIKQAVIQRGLALRRAAPALFARGTYQPLNVTGPKAGHVIAFMRSHDGRRSVVVVPRLPATLLGLKGSDEDATDSLSVPAEIWQDTMVHVPEPLAGFTLNDRISGTRIAPVGQKLRVGELLSAFPLALLVTE